LDFLIDIPLGDKLKLLRSEESLSLRQFSELVGVSKSTLGHLESGRNKEIGSESLLKIISHPRFVKYAIWLMFDQITEAQAQDAIDFLKSLPEYVEPPEGD